MNYGTLPSNEYPHHVTVTVPKFQFPKCSSSASFWNLP